MPIVKLWTMAPHGRKETTVRIYGKKPQRLRIGVWRSPRYYVRTYDTATGKPLFSSRDSKPRANFDEVSYERRVKYNWYTTEAADLLRRDYPEWVSRLHLKPVKGLRGSAS